MTEARGAVKRRKRVRRSEVGLLVGGRPSKYEARFATQLDTFFDIDCFRHIKLKNGDEKWAFVDFPTFERFALSIGVVPDTLLRWATEKAEEGDGLRHPEFAAAYERASARQRDLIVRGGLSGAYHPTIAALAAKNLVGWKEKTEVEEKIVHKFGDEQKKRLEAHYAAMYERAQALNAKVGKTLRLPRPAVTIDQPPAPATDE